MASTTLAIPTPLRPYVLLGARIRFNELLNEQRALEQTFPDLQHSKPVNGSASKVRIKIKKRRMNAAQRKEVSERMTRYWAAWREKKTRKKAARRKSRAVKTS